MPTTALAGTLDLEPDWSPADFGETDPTLFPTAPNGNV